MKAEIKSLDDVTREITIEFQEGSKVFVDLNIDEQIEGVGDVSLERRLRDVFYIKIGLASDAIQNEGKQIPTCGGGIVENLAEERRTWTAVGAKEQAAAEVDYAQEPR